jgi:hypothetical protein
MKMSYIDNMKEKEKDMAVLLHVRHTGAEV